MKWYDRLKKRFSGDKPESVAATEPVPPEIPIKPGKHILRWYGKGFRFAPVRRIYRKRARPVRFNEERQPVRMSFRQARMFDIRRSQQEANEIRRFTRERQLEEREERRRMTAQEVIALT